MLAVGSLPLPPFSLPLCPSILNPRANATQRSIRIRHPTRPIPPRWRPSRSPATAPCSMPSPISPKDPARTQSSFFFTASPATKKISTSRRPFAATAGTSSTSTIAAPGAHPATSPSPTPLRTRNPPSPTCATPPTRKSSAPTPPTSFSSATAWAASWPATSARKTPPSRPSG